MNTLVYHWKVAACMCHYDFNYFGPPTKMSVFLKLLTKIMSNSNRHNEVTITTIHCFNEIFKRAVVLSYMYACLKSLSVS